MLPPVNDAKNRESVEPVNGACCAAKNIERAVWGNKLLASTLRININIGQLLHASGMRRRFYINGVRTKFHFMSAPPSNKNASAKAVW